jgi:hypothetical protein
VRTTTEHVVTLVCSRCSAGWTARCLRVTDSESRFSATHPMMGESMTCSRCGRYGIVRDTFRVVPLAVWV